MRPTAISASPMCLTIIFASWCCCFREQCIYPQPESHASDWKSLQDGRVGEPFAVLTSKLSISGSVDVTKAFLATA